MFNGIGTFMILINAIYVLPWLINLDVVGLVVIEDNYGTNVGNYFKVIIWAQVGKLLRNIAIECTNLYPCGSSGS